jgi:Flp pilus assembly protein CpaB
MRSTVLIPLVAGLAAGVFALYSLLSAFQEKNRQMAMPTETVAVLVASSDIPHATTIGEDMFVEVSVPKTKATAKLVGDKTSLVGRVSALKIVAGCPIMTNMLAPEGTPPGAQHQIERGYRPVSIMADAHSVELLEPGDRVDVYYAEKTRSRGFREMRPILQNIEVFSVGDKRPGMGIETVEEAKNSRGRRSASRRMSGQTAVYLLLPIDQANTFEMAKVNGDISLLQRAYGDDSALAVTDLRFSELEEAAASEADPVHEETVEVAQPFKVVKVLQGGEEKEATFPVGDEVRGSPSSSAGNGVKPGSPRASGHPEGRKTILTEPVKRKQLAEDYESIGE